MIGFVVPSIILEFNRGQLFNADIDDGRWIDTRSR